MVNESESARAGAPPVPPPPAPRRPVAVFIAINAAVIFLDFLRSASHAHALALVFRGLYTVMFVSVSTIILVVVHLNIRDRALRPWLRAALYLIPAILTVLLFSLNYVPGLNRAFQRPNQRSPFASPSGQYVVKVSDAWEGWRFELCDAKGNVLLDDHTGFNSNLSVYWYWDKDDRLWVHNSDDGWTWVYDREGSHWKRSLWEGSGENETRKDLTPPNELYTGH